jgi:hypothetical protein
VRSRLCQASVTNAFCIEYLSLPATWDPASAASSQDPSPLQPHSRASIHALVCWRSISRPLQSLISR